MARNRCCLTPAGREALNQARKELKWENKSKLLEELQKADKSIARDTLNKIVNYSSDNSIKCVHCKIIEGLFKLINDELETRGLSKYRLSDNYGVHYQELEQESIPFPSKENPLSPPRELQNFEVETVTINPYPSKKIPYFTPRELQSFEFEAVTINPVGRITKNRLQSQFFKEDLGNGITLEMVEISIEKPENNNESSNTEICNNIPAFFISKYPITQDQWGVVAGLATVRRELKLNPSKFPGKNRPVEQISWDDAVEFCERLRVKTGLQYRLPSEIEWEYACQANARTPFHFGKIITTEVANYNGHFKFEHSLPGIDGGETSPVGFFNFPNFFGLYDMHGNVWEWCDSDSNPEATEKVLKGGCWNSKPEECYSSNRLIRKSSGISSDYGFRIVLSLTY